MKRWRFRLIDTAFFRDGSPLISGELGAYHHQSLFPPPMTTLVGAIRTFLARSQGWLETTDQKLVERWDRNVLGDHQSLGKLKFKGPYLEMKGEPLFPLPNIWLGDDRRQFHGWLLPGKKIESDLGSKCLLTPTTETGKLLQVWGNRRALQRLLNHQPPSSSDLFFSEDVWAEELRVGIRREHATAQVVEGHFYLSSHIRPVEGLRICVNVEGVPEHWEIPERWFTPLGGEGRFAEVTITSSFSGPDSEVPSDFGDDQKLRFFVSLITPMKISHQGKYLIEQGPLVSRQVDPSLNHLVCISASLGKALSLGGWDLETSCPKPLEPFLPAGSTWFYEVEADDPLVNLLKSLHGTCIGEMTEYGFGEVVIGRWEELV